MKEPVTYEENYKIDQTKVYISTQDNSQIKFPGGVEEFKQSFGNAMAETKLPSIITQAKDYAVSLIPENWFEEGETEEGTYIKEALELPSYKMIPASYAPDDEQLQYSEGAFYEGLSQTQIDDLESDSSKVGAYKKSYKQLSERGREVDNDEIRVPKKKVKSYYEDRGAISVTGIIKSVFYDKENVP